MKSQANPQNEDAVIQERAPLTFEAAEALLPEGDFIHVFRNPNGMLLGADWERAEILSLLKTGKPQLAGELAKRMGHGLCCEDKNGNYVFVSTKDSL